VGIVDDDPSVRKGLARLVKSAGYRVEVFASARDFLTRPEGEDPSCLLIDVRMPGLTGLELQEALASRGAGCRSSSSRATVMSRAASRP
jgi:FixJ family two-component response regulator